ncbi:MAG: hypothetical protein AAGJ37_14860 [Pseudomonadota bacterium]
MPAALVIKSIGIRQTSAAKKEDYAYYRTAISLVKDALNNDWLSSLSDSKLTFYIIFENELNPFYINIHPSNMHIASSEIADSTLQMIRNIDLYLLLTGPDGRTALEHVESNMRLAKLSSNKELQLMYAKVHTQIRANITPEISFRKERQLANSKLSP